jgi:hypothetical protein
MPFNLRLPVLFGKMRWKVKIRDKERVEDPHITIIRGTKTLRVSLRDERFMDGGSWKDMPNGLREFVLAHWEQLCAEWDGMYPHNPVWEDEGGDEDDKA